MKNTLWLLATFYLCHADEIQVKIKVYPATPSSYGDYHSIHIIAKNVPPYSFVYLDESTDGEIWTERMYGTWCFTGKIGWGLLEPTNLPMKYFRVRCYELQQ